MDKQELSKLAGVLFACYGSGSVVTDEYLKELKENLESEKYILVESTAKRMMRQSEYSGSESRPPRPWEIARAISADRAKAKMKFSASQYIPRPITDVEAEIREAYRRHPKFFIGLQK